MNNKKVLPVLKVSSYKIFALLKCVHDHPFDRDGLREAVLNVYPGRDEKSVFRGMVIPTLRRLGLIIGYEQSIRLSANGALIVAALNHSEAHGLRVLRAILLEIDQATAQFTQELVQTGTIAVEQFQDMQVSRIDAPSRIQSLERVRDWIAYLRYTGTVCSQDGRLQIDLTNLRQAKTDLEVTGKDSLFKQYLFDGYKEIVQRQSGVRSIDIEDLREKIAVSVYADKFVIITRNQFDSLLKGMPHITDEYTITFGRSMGPEENLFILDGKYYQTLSIRFTKEPKI